MTLPAHKLEPEVLFHEVATVVSIDDGGALVTVRTATAHISARRATSCLVAPREDDRVALAMNATGDTWVLAVLERRGDDICIEAPGNATVRAGGRLDLVGTEGVSLVSRAVTMASERLSLRAMDADIGVEKLRVAGETLLAEVQRVRSFGKSVDTVVERFSQRVKRSFRRVEELDHVQAKAIDMNAETTLSMRSDTAVLTADQLIKIDGKQVHVG